jgi:hypothetical protein
MTESDAPTLYRVDYSAAVKRRLQELSGVAIARGDGPAFLVALIAFGNRLSVYPQFGDPMVDLAMEEGQIRLGIIRPIAMRYAVYEESRLVICGALPILLPMDKPDVKESE